MTIKKSIGQTLDSFHIAENQYLYFYASLYPIFNNEEVSKKLITFNNSKTRYPLSHYFFLIEYLLFYQKRRVSTYITTILDKIIYIMSEHQFPDWYLRIHLNSIGFFNFMSEIRPIVDSLINETKDWHTLYYKLYYNKEKLNFFEYCIDKLNFFNFGKKLNAMSIPSSMSLLLISLQYSLISYIDRETGVCKLFNSKIKFDKEQHPLSQLYGHTLNFGVEHEWEFMEFYNKLTSETYIELDFHGLTMNDGIKTPEREMIIPIKKMIQNVSQDFEIVYTFLKNKAFFTFLTELNINKKKNDIDFEENQESQKVKDIYLETFKDFKLEDNKYVNY